MNKPLAILRCVYSFYKNLPDSNYHFGHPPKADGLAVQSVEATTE